MRNTGTATVAVTYALVWVVSTLAGGVLVAAGAHYWVLPAYDQFAQGAPVNASIGFAAPGLALVVLGLVVWKVASAVVHYRTLSAAFAAETEERLNTEAMKSDILSVMDERLADMKQDTQRTRRIVERERSEDAADEFEFPR